MQTLSIPAAAAPAPSAFSSNAELALTLLGPSPTMAQLWSQMRRLAPHMRTLLLTGAPDCGQEAVARLLLDLSPQPGRFFLTLRAADAEERLSRAQAPGGLPAEVFLFLPDVDALSAAAQDGILRLLKSRRPSTLSVVAATSENLRALVSVGRFAGELAEALGAVRIAVPALKERPEDLPMLLNQMIHLRCQAKQRAEPQLTEALLRASMQHAWSGNLRELSELVEELLNRNPAKGELDLPDWTRAVHVHRLPKNTPEPARLIRLDTVVQEHIYAVLRACSGNKFRAAEVLGISRSTLYRMLEAAAQDEALPLAS